MTAYLGKTYNSRGRRLHTDPDCPHLGKCEDYREVDPVAHPHKDWCRHCTGEANHGGGSNGHYESLLAAAQEAAD